MTLSKRLLRPARLAFGLILSLVLSLVWIAPPAALANSAQPEDAPVRQTSDTGRIGRAAIAHHQSGFEKNVGQAGPSTRFIRRSATGVDYFSPSEVRFTSTNQTSEVVGRQEFRLTFEGADPRATLAGGTQVGAVNYLRGTSPEGWLTNIPVHSVLRARDIYPGIDVVWYSNGTNLEYDLVAARGSDLAAARLSFSGAGSVDIDDAGNLILSANGTDLVQRAPVAYQDTADGRRFVSCAYSLETATSVSFRLGQHDPMLPVVVDPVLSYSTFVGGSDFDSVRDIAVDQFGAVYAVGETASTDFPRVGGVASDTGDGALDAFVVKVNPTGSAFTYATYLGGNGDDSARSIAVDAAGNAYITGSTKSSDFPVLNAFADQIGGAEDAFVTKLNSMGSGIIYSTYLGGESDDFATAVGLDGQNGMIVAGQTLSTQFPLVNSLQVEPGDNLADVFVSRLSPDGQTLSFSTYLGAEGADSARDLAVTASSVVTLTGVTNSKEFPVSQPSFGDPGDDNSDAFVTRIDTNQPAIVYSRYMGGSNADEAHGIAVDASGSAYVVGWTDSLDFPVVNPIQVDPVDGARDAFAFKLNSTGLSVGFSTYLGGSAADEAMRVALGVGGEVYIGGFTESANFPVTDAIQVGFAGGTTDGFLAKLNSLGTVRAYSTFFGGTGSDRILALAVDESRNAYIAGTSDSADLPAVQPIQTDQPGADGFIAKIGESAADVAVTINALPDPVRSGQQLTYTIDVTNSGPDAAGNVHLQTTVPPETTFVSAMLSQGNLETPPVGASGIVRASLGILPAGESATLVLTVQVLAEPNDTIVNTATVSSTAFDPNTVNNTDADGAGVIDPITPPSITLVESLVVPGKPYRIRITGANFVEGAQVFIGVDATPWPSVKFKNSGVLVVKKGDELKARFPKRVAVTVRVVNPDGGSASFDFTR